MSEHLTPCKVCEKPCEEDFCSEGCERYYETAVFICHLCSATVEIQFEERHKGRPCLENRMDKVREEIGLKEDYLKELQQEWEQANG